MTVMDTVPSGGQVHRASVVEDLTPCRRFPDGTAVTR
jgi:hypothetical protein